MKKKFTLLMILLATAFQSIAQDTITGVVSRVDAPYFEQNVCDTRFAITSEGETYYVMVDNYWPNPYLEDLVVHYDTIAIGNEIEVVGNILEMEDGNGEVFQAIDISKNLNSNYQQILGFFDNNEGACFYHYNGFEGYHITINGELQTTPFVINGRTLMEGKRYLFVGISGGGVFELFDALPYDVEDVSISGTLTMENDLCLSSPYGETHFLSLFDGEEYHYLTQKRKLQNNYINDTVFSEGDSVEVGGFEFIRYDLFGATFKAFEFIKVQSNVEHILVGGVGDAPMPYIGVGPPLPGLELAFYSDNINYYLKNPHEGDGFYGSYIVGNDTIQVTMQQLKATLVAGVFINNYLYPCYTADINKVEFEEHEETLQCTLDVTSNPFYSGNILVVNTQDNETYYLKQFIYQYSAPDHIIVGDHTIYVGDSFTAIGMVSNWYQNQYYIKKVIEITDVEFDGVEESFLSDIQVFPNPSNGIFEIISGQSISNVFVYNNMGKMMLEKPIYTQKTVLDLTECKGLVYIHIVFEDGHKITKKEIIL
jgi:hypothetical protein